MTETWNVFAGTDIFLGLLGAAGFLSMIVVIFSASSRVDTRERILRKAAEAKLALEELEKTEE